MKKIILLLVILGLSGCQIKFMVVQPEPKTFTRPVSEPDNLNWSRIYREIQVK